MTLTLEEMLNNARAVVERIDGPGTQVLIAEENALLLDVRDEGELEKDGRAVGAYHVTRGMLEFRADPKSHLHDPEFSFTRPIVLFCSGGWRVVLAGKLLKDMGFERIYSLGTLKKWIEGGGEVEFAIELSEEPTSERASDH